MKKTLWIFSPLLLQFLLLAGCSSDNAASGAGNDASTSDAEPPSDAGSLPDGEDANADPGLVSYLGAGGLGVADLTKSLDFYSRVLGLTLDYSLSVPNYVDEDILYYKESPNTRYSDVVIGNYTDTTRPHNYKNNPVKLVFHVPSAKTTIDLIRGEGLTVLSEPAPDTALGGVTVARGLDPDGYTLELIEDTTITVPFLSAAGIGVSDIAKSTDFYTSIFHMRVKGSMISEPNLWDQVELEYPSGKGSNVLLMHYTDGATHDYTNLPVKLVNYVPDSAATSAAIAARGLTILSQPSVLDVGGTLARIALGTDPDGYTMEIITVVGMDDGGFDSGAGSLSVGDGASDSATDGTTEAGVTDGGTADGSASDGGLADH